MGTILFFVILYILYKGLTAPPNALGMESPFKSAAIWVIIVFAFMLWSK